MEYDDSSTRPIEGAFYQKPNFNYFRKEHEFSLETLLKPINDADENSVLKDNNLLSIKQSPDFAKNKSPGTPTNRICTSLL